MSKIIEITYDLDYGIFTLKTKGFYLSKTKLKKFQSKLKKEIDSIIKQMEI